MNTLFIKIDPQLLVGNVIEKYKEEARLGGFDEVAFYFLDRTDPYQRMLVKEPEK